MLCVLPGVLQVYSLLLSANSAPTDVFTQPLLPVINELSACVCVETSEGPTQSHMCTGWTDKRTNYYFFFESEKTVKDVCLKDSMPAVKLHIQIP